MRKAGAWICKPRLKWIGDRAPGDGRSPLQKRGFMKALRWLNNNLERWLLTFFLAAMTVVLVYQIILRTFFNDSVTWAEEISRFILVWSGFMSISFTIRNGSAMRLTMILEILPRLARNFILILAQAIVAALFIWMFYESCVMMKNVKQSSAALELPMKYVYLSLPVGFGLTVIRCCQNIWRMGKNFMTGDEAGMEKKKEDEALQQEIAEAAGGTTNAG